MNDDIAERIAKALEAQSAVLPALLDLHRENVEIGRKILGYWNTRDIRDAVSDARRDLEDERVQMDRLAGEKAAVAKLRMLGYTVEDPA